MTNPTGTPSQRFWRKVQGGDYTDCWIWTASRGHDGYGHFKITRTKKVTAHRWAYEFLVAPIPDGLQLDHLCRNTSCVNPWHLEPVTPRINFRRGNTVTHRTHCPQGHPYDQANTYHYRGKRGCRACRNEATRESRRKRREMAA